MTAFRIVFHGVGYNLQDENCMSDGSSKLGFYVVVNVEADEVEQAIQLAYEKLLGSEQYIAALGEGEHPDRVLSVDQCYELSTRDPEEAEVSGLILYRKSTKMPHAGKAIPLDTTQANGHRAYARRDALGQRLRQRNAGRSRPPAG